MFYLNATPVVEIGGAGGNTVLVSPEQGIGLHLDRVGPASVSVLLSLPLSPHLTHQGLDLTGKVGRNLRSLDYVREARSGPIILGHCKCSYWVLGAKYVTRKCKSEEGTIGRGKSSHKLDPSSEVAQERVTDN